MTTPISFNASASFQVDVPSKNRFEQISFPGKCLNAVQSGAKSVATALKTALLFLAHIPANVFSFVAGAIKNGSAAVLNTVGSFFCGRHVEVSPKLDADEPAPAEVAEALPSNVEEVVQPCCAHQEDVTSEVSSIQSSDDVYLEFDGEMAVEFEQFSAEISEEAESTEQSSEAAQEVEPAEQLNTWVATGAAVATVAAAVGLAHFIGYVNLTDNALVNGVRDWISPAPTPPSGFLATYAPVWAGGNPAV